MSDDPVLDELLSDARPVLERLLAEPEADPDPLRRRLDDWVARHRVLHPRSLEDGETSAALVKGCRALLDDWPSLDARGRRLAQAAIRYFLLEDDGTSDSESPFGYDDDREVFDAVARALGRPSIRTP